MGGRRGRNARARDRSPQPPRVDPFSLFKCLGCTLKEGQYKQSFIDKHMVDCKVDRKKAQDKESARKKEQEKVTKSTRKVIKSGNNSPKKQPAAKK